MKFHLLFSLVLCLYQVESYTWERKAQQGSLVKVKNDARFKRQDSNQDKRVVCIYASWSVHRQGANKFTPEDLNTDLCTHIMYGYARPDRKEGVLQYDTKIDIEDKGWERFTSLKKRNPDLKLMLAVGGLFEGSTRFSRIAADPKERQIFVKSASALMRDYNFDGLEMSWVYPGFSVGHSPSDKENYPLLLKDLREEFGRSFLISITVPGLERLIDIGYDLPEILKYVDFMNIWAGAYHPENAPTVNHPSPLYPLPNDPITSEGNVDTTMTALLKRGVPASAMNMLIANYGSYYILEDPASTDLGSETEDEAENNEYRGGLIYNELCQKIRKEDWTVKRVNTTAMGPYAYKGNQWVAWDDEQMVKNKARYAKEKKLGGIGFWTVDMDDFKGACHLTNYPLLRGGREEFFGPSDTPTSTQQPSVSLTGLSGNSRPLPLPPGISNDFSAQSPPLSPDDFPAQPEPPILTPDFPVQPNPPIIPGPSFPVRPTPPQTPPSDLLPQPAPPILPPSQQNPAVVRPSFPIQPALPSDPKFPVNSDREDRVDPSFSNDLDVINRYGEKTKDGISIYKSNRDIIFQNIRLWIMNYFYNSSPLVKAK